MRFLFFYITFLFQLMCFAQNFDNDSSINKKISRIKSDLNSVKSDTAKINLYVEYEYLIYELDKELSNQINQKIIQICNRNLNIQKQNKKFFLKQKSLALSNLGYNAQINGELKKALGFYNKALIIDKEINNKRSIAASYSNIGAIYDYMGDYLNSITFYQKSLKIQQEIGNKRGESDLYNNFGVIYNTLRQYDKSLDYFNKSLKIDQELKDESAQLVTLNNIGSLYAKKLQYEKAIEITKKSLAKSIRQNDEIGIAMTRGNIGSYYYELNQLDSAQNYLEYSISNFRKQKNFQHLATFLPYFAKVKKDKGQFDQALKLAKEAYQLSIETSDLTNKHASAITLYNLYKSKKNFKEALKFYEEFVSLENQIQNDENKKQLLGFEFEKNLPKTVLKIVKK